MFAIFHQIFQFAVKNKTIIGLKLSYPGHSIVEGVVKNKTIIGLKCRHNILFKYIY